MDIWFSTFGKGYAPAGWKISSLKYTNRLYVILGGTAYFLYRGEEKKLLPGVLYLFPHRLPFRVRQDENDPVNHLFFDFALSPPFLGDQLIEIPLDSDALIASTVKCLLYTTDKTKEELKPIMRGYFESLLRLILLKNKELHLTEERLAAVFCCIHENYQQPLSDEFLAELVHLEKNYFIRLFKKVSGLTPYQYLREYRLNRAAVMLETGMSVAQTALNCGYESAFSLSHAMKKSRGIAPSAFRKKSAQT